MDDRIEEILAETPEDELENPSNSSSTVLKMTFAKANGNNVSFTMKYARQDSSNANIKSLMEGMVANGEIFENTPVALKSAQIVTTETTEVDLS